MQPYKTQGVDTTCNMMDRKQDRVETMPMSSQGRRGRMYCTGRFYQAYIGSEIN
jgi:hypothetical protein